MNRFRIPICLLLTVGFSTCSTPTEGPTDAPAKVSEADYVSTESGLKYYDFKKGSGSTPNTGQTVVVHYSGWLTDGKMFDSSVVKKKPFSFVLGTGGVISGWDEGVASMSVGGKRQLVLPPDLAYGEQGAGNVIPAGATLIFEIELLSIK